MRAVRFNVDGGVAAATAQPGAGFEVASIKPARPDQRGYSIRPQPGRVTADNVTLKLLIAEAYHVYDFQISGGPKWIDWVGHALAQAGTRPSR